MRNRRCPLYPILLLALAPGCQAFHQYRPVAVQVRDAETKKPIPGAVVHISYPLTRPSYAPYDSTGPTGGDGIARLRAAPYGDEGILIEAAAEGYLAENKHLSIEAVQAIAPAHFFEDVNRRAANDVLELYAGPSPTVELVVPTGYRGIVKAEMLIQADATCPPGQRTFSYEVPPSGVIQVVGPSLLGRVGPSDFRARYVDGTPLTSHVREAEIGYWCVKCEGNFLHFLVGTRSEYDALRPSQIMKDADAKRSTGGKGSGQGRHRKNVQLPGDPGS